MQDGGLEIMRTLVIGDLHCPCDHNDYLSFCKSIQKIHKTNNTIFIGDIVDHEAISMHDKNPQLPGPSDEFLSVLDRIERYYKVFPNSSVCIGNHDARVLKKAAKYGIPNLYLKAYSSLYNTPGWTWDYSFHHDGVYYSHGDGWSGQHPSFLGAKARLESVVTGHCHSVAGVNWIKGPTTMYFGMNVGSGVDQRHPAFDYSKPHHKKAILSCGVVIDGKQAYLEIMK
jgi:predicted phosphodiesterase